ncbi:hypothetical protein VTN02DRAFT_4153 [Thermoascus thermophilus]
MRPPRLILLVLCFIFLPIMLTCLSLLSAHPRQDASADSFAGRTSRLRALFSFNAPSSLFPPSAIISLTDDNSTFFLARPAAFGPLLPAKGLSGQLWIGSGFGDDALRKGGATAGAEGELGCSDVPGWGEGKKQHKLAKGTEKSTDRKAVTQPASGPDDSTSSRILPRSDSDHDPTLSKDRSDTGAPPSADDGTDDHLHHPLPDSDFPGPGSSEAKNKPPAHADIQSLQESAEIAGKIVLLSRGGCGFLEKVKWVQRRGGVALIVGDDTRGGSLVTMYARGDTSNITIPAVFTSHTTAHLLSSLIPPQTVDEADDGSKTLHVEGSTKKPLSKGGAGSTTTTKAAPTPASTSRSGLRGDVTDTSGSSGSERGLLHWILSLVGFSSDSSYSWHLPEDSRRPPSSGNIDWVLVDNWEEEEASSGAKAPADKSRETADGRSSDSKDPESGSSVDGDGFVIGVQDWRDPDLVAPKSSSVPQPSTAPGKPKGAGAGAQDGDKNSNSGSNGLKGGSITPGSGEYMNPDKSTNSKKPNSDYPDAGTEAKSDDSTAGNWFSNHFGWAEDQELGSGKSSPEGVQETPKGEKFGKIPNSQNKPSQGKHAEPGEQEGLWVTLTPTSMSTSPFFDTLLVLVVSPLITLTVVYALLLLRSRIRRRRWRAPKSVVDRLPVRTYHTIPASSSTSQSSASPGASTPTSPLLVSGSRSPSARSRPRSQTTSGIVSSAAEAAKEAPSGEKSSSGSSLWRRIYTGRQVECVVCLEEYVDGESRVMSLPCGHEFHVECITPWLTTRRRTCPICKGDVVRSMAHYTAAERHEQNGQTADDTPSRALESRHGSREAGVPISGSSEDDVSDLERGDGSAVPLLNERMPQSSWRNLASLSFSALRGDTLWHQARTDRNR